MRPVILQLVGWTLIGLLDFSLNRATAPDRSVAWAVYASALLGGGGLAITSVLALIYRRASHPIVIAGGALAGTAVWYVGNNLVDAAVDAPLYEPLLEGLFDRGMLFLFIMLTWHGGLLAVRASARAVRAERLASEARVQALRYQINPHFLHNVLNSAIALIDEDPARAQTMLELLSQLLRRTLEEDTGAETTLARELELIDRYLEIQRVRFEDKLQVVIDVPAAIRDRAMPPLVLHALVENAVKHGLETAVKLPVVITITATITAGTLHVEVTNTGTLAPIETRRTGVGLKNVADRLDALYPDRHAFAISETDGVVRATLEIRA